MSDGIKNLAKNTAIYGMSSIVGRIPSWLLVPYYTRILTCGHGDGAIDQTQLQVDKAFALADDFERFGGAVNNR